MLHEGVCFERRIILPLPAFLCIDAQSQLAGPDTQGPSCFPVAAPVILRGVLHNSTCLFLIFLFCFDYLATLDVSGVQHSQRRRFGLWPCISF